MRGVSEGDMTRYALSRREPLLAQLEAFLDLVQGGPEGGIVTLDEGVGIVATAEAVLASAASGESVALASPPAGAGV